MRLSLHCGDSRNILQDIQSNSVDIVITSPPYNIGVNYDSYVDKLSSEGYEKFLEECFIEIKRILKPSGSFFYNVASKASLQEQMSIHWNVCSKFFKIQNTITWVKSIYIPSLISSREGELLKNNLPPTKNNDELISRLVEGKTFGHNKPLNSKRFLNNQFEYILHLTNDKKVNLNKLDIGIPYTYKSEIKRRGKEEDLKDRGNVWYIPYETRNSSKEHPAAFPPALPEMCIKLHGSDKDTVVLDPFCGEGNTGVACKNLDVSFIGIDSSINYIGIAAKRLGILSS